MNITWDVLKQIGEEAVKKMIQLKYITVNEYISIGGVASIFANKVWEVEREERKRKEVDQMLATMQKYFPEKFEEFLQEAEKGKDE